LSRERVDISLPPSGKLVLAGAGLLLVSMIVLLVAMLAVLADSREHIVAQDRKINRIVKGTDPVLDEVEPVADDARALLGQATPFVRDLRAAMIPLLREFDTGRLFQFVDLGSDLARGLRDSEFIPRTLRAADLVPVMKEILAQTLEVQRATLATQRETLGTQRQTLGTQRETLDIQRRTFAVLRRSLAVQEEALVHVRSIDRKTGGPAPAPAPLPRR
jgi:hypothetical protein